MTKGIRRLDHLLIKVLVFQKLEVSQLMTLCL
jgi:hypothetical protein